MVLLCGWRMTLSNTADFPLAVTIVVDRLGSVDHRGDIADANGHARGGALYHDAGNFCRGVNLAADQSENQLMIAFEQAPENRSSWCGESPRECP